MTQTSLGDVPEIPADLWGAALARAVDPATSYDPTLLPEEDTTAEPPSEHDEREDDLVGDDEPWDITDPSSDVDVTPMDPPPFDLD